MNFALSARGASFQRPHPRHSRRAWATAASLLFHLVVAFAIFGTASGDLVSGGAVSGGAVSGGDSGPAISVTLVGSDLQPPSQASVSALSVKVRHDVSTSPLVAAAATEDRQMARLLNGFRAKAAHEPVPESRTPANGATGRRTDGLAEIDRDIRGPEAPAASTGGLWGQVAPCWRTLPVAARAPVSLEIILDSAGALRRPPRIIRPSNEPVSEARLKAEAQALAALSACMPRHDLRFAGGVYRLDFGPDR